MALLAILARRGGGRTGHGQAEALVGWAAALTAAGSDEPAVWTLAGMGGPAHHPSEVDEQLAAVLDALGLPEPASPHELYDAQMRTLCDAVLRGVIEPTVALHRAVQICVDARYARRYEAWCRLDEDVALQRSGEGVVFGYDLRTTSLADHVQETATEMVTTLPNPRWLASYLTLAARPTRLHRLRVE